METQATADDTGLRDLDDAELISRWAAARQQLALTVEGKPGRFEAKRLYDTLAGEYRRRLDGGSAARAGN